MTARHSLRAFPGDTKRKDRRELLAEIAAAKMAGSSPRVLQPMLEEPAMTAGDRLGRR